ncbi:MAG: glycosyltransferase family 2 protein [Pikeienuella sp.]
MSSEYQIGCLWVEGPLSFMEQLCLVSFRDAGHHCILYTYGDVTRIPDGIEQRDANEVLPQSGFLTHERTGSPALHSDLFRYKMLENADRMIWADTDAYCVKTFKTPNGHFYGWESKHHVNGGVLGLPPDSETLRELLEFTSDEFAIPEWLNEETKAEYRAAKERGEPVHAGEMKWGVWGPHAVTHFLKKTGEIKYALPRHALYPFSFKERRKMLKRETKTDDFVFDDTYSIHFYGRRMRKRIVEAEGGVPRRWSPIGRLLKKHGVDPLAAPIPGSPVLPEPKVNPVEQTAPKKPSRLPDSERIVVLSTMKNEGPFILDWIAHNLYLGVDHFLIYTNDCDDGTVKILERLSEMGLVTRVENPFDREAQERPQRAALADAEKHPILAEADWIVPIDVDEYINVHTGDGTLRTLLGLTGSPDLLSMTWRFYGCSGVVEYEDKPVTEQFVRAAPPFTRKPHHNWGFKTIMRNTVKYGKMGVHRPLRFPDEQVRWLNGSGEEMPERYRDNGWRSAADCWGYNLVTLNHYAVRSVDSFLVKRDRGRVNHINRDQGIEYWSIFNRNDMFDRSILQVTERVQPITDKLKSDTKLASLHADAVAWHRAKVDELKTRPDFLTLFGELTVDPVAHAILPDTPDSETPKMPAPVAQTTAPQRQVVVEKSDKEKPKRDVASGEDVPAVLTGTDAQAAMLALEERNSDNYAPLSAPSVALNNDSVVIITSMKNEGPFILEWIAYHLSIGAKHFLVYTNDCDDGTDQILDRLAELGYVTRVDNPYKRDKGQKPQRGALNDAVNQPIVKAADWVLISDVDEFVNIHVGDGRFDDLIKASNGPNLISLTWKFFGNAGVNEFQDQFVTEQFTACAPEFIPKPRLGWGFKTLAHKNAPYSKLGVHRPLTLDEARADDARWVNGSGRQMPEFVVEGASWRSTKRSIGYQLATLNHYVLRSAESFLVKRERGRINHVDEDQGAEYWSRRNYATETDNRILTRLPAAKTFHAELMADKDLAALHEKAIAWHRDRIKTLKAEAEYRALYDRITATGQVDAVYYRKEDDSDDEA